MSNMMNILFSHCFVVVFAVISVPTLDHWITSNYSLTLNADYEAFDAYTQSNATKQEAMALEIVENGLGIDDDESLSDHLVITISDVRSGSIIIDYVLSANNELLMETALSNMDDSMGTIVVVDGIMFPYSSNVDLNAPSTTVFTTTLGMLSRFVVFICDNS